MAEQETHVIDIQCFAAMEECTKCGELHGILVIVNDDQDVYCKKCFDGVYDRAVEIRKQQQLDS